MVRSVRVFISLFLISLISILIVNSSSLTLPRTTFNNITVNGDLFLIGDILSLVDQELNASFLPSIDDRFDLGTVALRWQDGFFSNDVTALTFIGELKDGFRIENYSNEYANSGFDNENFTDKYDSRLDRWQLENITGKAINITNLNVSQETLMLGDLNLNANLVIAGNINISKTIIFSNESFNKLWNGSLVISTPKEPVNNLLLLVEHKDESNHFWIQEGAPEAASGITRSFMIVNELLVQNTTNITNCQFYMDAVGIAREDQIDCNTSTTGADLLVGDDIFVIGDIRVRDTQNETHFLSRELQIRDEMFRNITLSGINGSLVDNNLTISTLTGDTIVVNIETSEKILKVSTESIILTEGTNSSPILNQAFYTNRDNPILAIRTSLSEEAPGVAAFVLGANFTYASLIGGTTANNFIRGSYNRWLDQGAIYKSGFNINVSTEEINISTGIMKILLDKLNIRVNHSTSDFFVHIHTDGAFHQHNNLDDCSTYSTGEAIGNNKYFNVVCGIAFTHDEVGVMYCQTQDKPDSEHTKSIDAQLDVDFLRIFPPNNLIKLAYIPIVRVVVKRSAGDNTIQTLTTGKLFLDLRGTITANAGSTPSPSISSHPDLSNLDFASSGHTGFQAQGSFGGAYSEENFTNNLAENMSDIRETAWNLANASNHSNFPLSNFQLINV
ncbi:hypothetical protein LCGC14_1942010, partial [marine sediment metagenome]